MERDKLFVVVGVTLDVGVPVIVPLPVDVPLVLIVEDIEIESVPLCELDKLAPRVDDDDGVFNTLVEKLSVLDNVAIAVGESESILLPDTVADGVGTALDVILALPPREIVDGGVADGDDVILGVIKGVESGVGKPLPLPDGVAVGEGTALDVILALTPKEIVDSGVPDDEEVRLSVIDGVNGGVDEPLSLPEGVDVVEDSTLDVILELPPKETVDGGVSDDEDVRLCVGSVVGDIVNVSELVIVTETLELAVGVPVLEPVDESEPVSALDGDCEDDGVCDNDGSISDDEGVRVAELVSVSEDDKLEEIEAVTLGETVLLGVEEVDAPKVAEVVGVLDTEELKVVVNDDDDVKVPVFEPEPDCVTVADELIVEDVLAVIVSVVEGVKGGVDVGEVVESEESVPESVPEIVEVIVVDGLPVTVVELVVVPEDDCDELIVGDGVSVEVNNIALGDNDGV